MPVFPRRVNASTTAAVELRRHGLAIRGLWLQHCSPSNRIADGLFHELFLGANGITGNLPRFKVQRSLLLC